MSHYSVLVVCDDPSEEAIARILQPWHEFECTDIDDEYVKDIDQTKEARAEFESSRETFYVSPEGERFETSDERFYRDFTEQELVVAGPVALGTGAIPCSTRGIH